MLEYTGERAVPWNDATGYIMAAHVARYAWAVRYCFGRQVVDLGCGCGYGTFMLSWVAKCATGVDIDDKTITSAMHSFEAPNLSFLTADITQNIPHGDAYVAFEVLEHLDKPRQLIDSLNAPLLWSMPVCDGSEFHKKPYTLNEIDDLVGPIGWVQGVDGQITHVDHIWFAPVYVLGVRKCASC